MTIRTHEVLGQAAGLPDDFSEMPTVAGTPVVESGSNTDGEWTRLVDGTLICKFQETATYVSPTFLAYEWVFPSSFIDVTYALAISTTTINFTGSKRRGIPFSDTRSELSARPGLVGEGIWASGDAIGIDITATGRWK